MSSSSTPWEALNLVATYLDAKTLAISSCVSKSWFSSMSSDHLWEPILATHFPSLSTLPQSPPVDYRRLFALGYTAATRRRRHPLMPTLSLSDLFFAVTISTRGCDLSVVRPGDELRVDMPGMFRFGVGGVDGAVLREGVEEEVRVTWNMVLRGWRGVFTLMERLGKVGFVPGGKWWLSQELPAPGCCSGNVASAVVAEVKMGMCEVEGGNGVRVDEVGVGILNVVDWRYVSVEDGVRYLQHFLLPNNAT